MKTFKIKPDGTEYMICENADDLNIVRMNVLRNMVAEKTAGMEINDMIDWLKKRRPLYNEHDWASLFADDLNMLQRLNSSATKTFHDSAQLVFSVMTLSPGENPAEWSDSQAQDKLKKMASEGLTQGYVWEATEGFILASPKLWESFFLMSLAAHAKKTKSLEPSAESTESAADLSQSENG